MSKDCQDGMNRTMHAPLVTTKCGLTGGRRPDDGEPLLPRFPSVQIVLGLVPPHVYVIRLFIGDVSLRGGPRINVKDVSRGETSVLRQIVLRRDEAYIYLYTGPRMIGSFEKFRGKVNKKTEGDRSSPAKRDYIIMKLEHLLGSGW